MAQTTAFKLEEHINDWVKAEFVKLNLKNQKDFYTQSSMPDYEGALFQKSNRKKITIVL